MSGEDSIRFSPVSFVDQREHLLLNKVEELIAAATSSAFCFCRGEVPGAIRVLNAYENHLRHRSGEGLRFNDARHHSVLGRVSVEH